MPANLPPDYYEAEKRYRAASSPQGKIACIEEMLTIMPKHKGTDKLRADLRRRISKLKAAAQTKKGPGKRDTGFQIEREGAGQVVIAGTPNAGKSSLLAALSKAKPEISDAPMSTWKPLPGMMTVRDIQIQLIDTPALTPDYVEPLLFDLIRRCDCICAVVDILTDPVDQLQRIEEILRTNKILTAPGATEGDRQAGSIPMVAVGNKNDDSDTDDNIEIIRSLLDTDIQVVPVSAKTGRNLKRLKEEIFTALDIIRVYSKIPSKDPDMTAPFVLKRGGTVEEFARKVHKDFAQNLKAARMWGAKVFDGQMVNRTHVLHDGDIVELHL
jgi:hypothetical protein